MIFHITGYLDRVLLLLEQICLLDVYSSLVAVSYVQSEVPSSDNKLNIAVD